MNTPLTPDAIAGKLTSLNGWCLADDQCTIIKSYTFETFPQAFAFMTRIAFIAEQHNHHPDWCNRYNRVDVRLSSHDVGGVTERDFDLAQAIDDALQRMHKTV